MTFPGGMPGRVAGRLLAALLLVSVSTYYLLASVPFAYYHFLQFAHFSWLPAFIRLHAVLMAAGVALLLVALDPLPPGWRRRLALCGGIPSLWMAVTTAVPVLQSYGNARAMCVLPLLLLGAGAVLELAGRSGELRMRRAVTTSPAVVSTISAGLIVSLLYLTTAVRALSAQPAMRIDLIVPALLSMAAHVVAFLSVGAGFWLVVAVGRRWAWSAMAVALANAVWLGAMLTLMVRRLALSTLLMDDSYAFLLSLLIGMSLAIFAIATLISVRATAPASVLLLPDGRHASRWLLAASATVVLMACVFVLPTRLLLADWGGVLQKTLVIGAWISAILLTRSLPRRASAVVAIALVAGVPARIRMTTDPAPASGASSDGVEIAVYQYATLDRSVSTLLTLFRLTLTDRDYFASVGAAGDLTDRQNLPAVPLTVVPAMNASPAYRPHIFIIVVDSLRPDYLGAYRSAAAAFTPAIGRFAADSVVMRRAFTPYAGTALAQPAIWAGGLIPRVNYVKPFSAVNNLERLVTAAGYRRYVSMDEISRLTLERQDEIENLDPALAHPERKDQMFKFELCGTMGELSRLLDRDRADSRPIFVYTQPQNVHVRVIAEGVPAYEGIRVNGEEFFKPAVDAITRVDRCFGQFIDALQARNLYDDSIIVLTSDHGDGYGEEGRWAHAFYLAPETLRIPLIVHVPPRLRADWVWNTDDVVWSTGITPTLHELLGYGYEPSSALVGRPLAVRKGSVVQSARDGEPFLVQSSYSRAFGLLAADASWLYAANASQITEGYFTGGPDAFASTPLNDVERARLRKLLLDQIRAVGAYYGSSDKN